MVERNLLGYERFRRQQEFNERNPTPPPPPWWRSGENWLFFLTFVCMWVMVGCVIALLVLRMIEPCR